jgi:signal peptidase I
LALALVAMLGFRALVLTIYTVEGDGLSPEFMAGDHVMVNRWSYGLRTGSENGLFSYGRLCRQMPKIGDFIAYEDPRDSTSRSVLFGCCQALPGDTVECDGRMIVVPSVKDCADSDYYWISALGEGNPIDSRVLGFVSERRIIGRAFLVVFNHDASQPLLCGWHHERLFLLK